MSMTEMPARPISPHLSNWRWGPHMAVSIAHRVSGMGLAIVGVLGFTWWVLAASQGASAYDQLVKLLTPWYGKVVLIGLTWAFFQHLLSGVRHFILDVGAGYELGANKRGSIAVFVLAVVLTAAFWGYLMYLKG
jgi:succinate dehydrogenase / fumarate reductase, cytochrome b subunit